jgi:hypothetical protein
MHQLAQDELDDRSVVTQLKSAIQSGAIVSGAGQLSVRDIDVDSLDAAVQYAVHIGSRTAHASQLLATAQLVLALRKALLADDMPAARDLLDSVRGKVIAALAADEIQAVKAEIDNWVVISQLTSAISSGFAQVGPPRCLPLFPYVFSVDGGWWAVGGVRCAVCGGWRMGWRLVLCVCMFVWKGGSGEEKRGLRVACPLKFGCPPPPCAGVCRAALVSSILGPSR